MATRPPTPERTPPCRRLRGALALWQVPLLVLVSAGPSLGQRTAHDPGELGAVSFQVTCDPAVQPHFDHALGPLHHMMYQQSRQAFERIAEQHPDCGLAYWGTAMTLFQPLWPARPNPEARQRGWEAVQRAQQHGSLSDRERGLVAATAAFFADPHEDV